MHLTLATMAEYSFMFFPNTICPERLGTPLELKYKDSWTIEPLITLQRKFEYCHSPKQPKL